LSAINFDTKKLDLEIYFYWLKNLFLIRGKAWAKNFYSFIVKSRLDNFKPSLFFYKPNYLSCSASKKYQKSTSIRREAPFQPKLIV
jgi:hypothetical protein